MLAGHLQPGPCPATCPPLPIVLLTKSTELTLLVRSLKHTANVPHPPLATQQAPERPRLASAILLGKLLDKS